MRFLDGSYGVVENAIVYPFRGNEGNNIYAVVLSNPTLQKIVWYHAKTVFQDALPALAVFCNMDKPDFREDSVKVDYDDSPFVFPTVASYGSAKRKTAYWEQAPTVAVSAWVERDIALAKTADDLADAVQYAACVGGSYSVITSLNHVATKKVDKHFFDTHIKPKLTTTVIREWKDGGVLVARANNKNEDETMTMIGKTTCFRIWHTNGQVSACWYPK